ncbi:MAG: pectate lyase [Prosthecobacter sp.]|nr:pectate lyase [Prosthecobacter sp.]
MKAISLLLLLATPFTALAADALPDPQEVLNALKKATAFCTDKLAVQGGYASSWPADLSLGMTEHSKSKTVISIQPPGTTTLGLAFVQAWKASGDPQFLEAARAAGKALVACQLASGGWSSDFDFAPEKAAKYWLHQQVLAGDKDQGKRQNTSTLDDNKTQSALLFLLELAHLPECKEDLVLQETVRFGLESLLAAQFPNGAWPQQFNGPADPATPVKKAAYPAEWPRQWPDVKYISFYTLNDGNHQRAIELLLRAHELTGEARYLAAAQKGGDFLILAQMPDPQPAWAQQYNHAMEPVWARKFEPPCVTGGESISAMETLHLLYVVTGDEKYLKPLPAAFSWYERSVLPDGQYARFYELKTNKPLYFVKDTYELTYDDGNLPTHYGFKMDHIQRDLTKLKEQMAQPREKLLEKRATPTTEKAWTSQAKGAAAKAATALKTQNAEGIWMTKDKIDGSEVTKHLMALARYLEGARKGGAEFEKLRK